LKFHQHLAEATISSKERINLKEKRLTAHLSLSTPCCRRASKYKVGCIHFAWLGRLKEQSGVFFPALRKHRGSSSGLAKAQKRRQMRATRSPSHRASPKKDSMQIKLYYKVTKIILKWVKGIAF